MSDNPLPKKQRKRFRKLSIWVAWLPTGGGFERLVADLNRTGNVTVEHDVKLPGKSGASRQIDVLIRHREGLIEPLVIIDCKHWKQRVGRSEVDALAASVRELNASRGVLFSVMGFESGAITQAEADGIELFTIRELTDEEWGAPGRHVDFFIALAQRAVRNVAIPEATTSGLSSPPILNLRLGPGGVNTETPIEENSSTSARTLEIAIEALVQHAATTLLKPEILFGGANATRLFWRHVDIAMKHPIVVPYGTGKVVIPKIALDLGVRISQSHVHIDRGANYAFVLAVEDRVRGIVRTTSRRQGEQATEINDPVEEAGIDDGGPIFQNGSIMTFWLTPLFDFSELADLPKGEFRDILT